MIGFRDRKSHASCPSRSCFQSDRMENRNKLCWTWFPKRRSYSETRHENDRRCVQRRRKRPMGWFRSSPSARNWLGGHPEESACRKQAPEKRGSSCTVYTRFYHHWPYANLCRLVVCLVRWMRLFRADCRRFHVNNHRRRRFRPQIGGWVQTLRSHPASLAPVSWEDVRLATPNVLPMDARYTRSASVVNWLHYRLRFASEDDTSY